MDPDRAYERAELSQGLRAPHPPPDIGGVAQGDTVRDGHGGHPSRHPGQHLPAPHGSSKCQTRGLRSGWGDPVLLPEPAETGRGCIGAITTDHPVIRKTKEQIDREKAKGGKDKVAVRG